jgi:hypothetical protein
VTDRPTFLVKLKPGPHITGSVTSSLRRLLKAAWRVYGWRCVAVTEETPTPDKENDHVC